MGSIAGMIEENRPETVVYIPQQEAYPEESWRERGVRGSGNKSSKRQKNNSPSLIQQVRLGWSEKEKNG